MGFFFINNILFRKKSHGWEQLLQLQPDITKNVVSIFIEVLYCSKVGEYLLPKLFHWKRPGFCIILNVIVLHIHTYNNVHDWNYWLSVACLQLDKLLNRKRINAVNQCKGKLCSSSSIVTPPNTSVPHPLQVLVLFLFQPPMLAFPWIPFWVFGHPLFSLHNLQNPLLIFIMYSEANCLLLN